MHIHEHIALMMARERMEDAARAAEQARAVGHAGVPRPSVRISLGIALIRLGRWIQGRPSPSGTPIGLPQA
jgi:hypothetical protein